MTTGFGQARQLIEIIQAPVDLGAVVAGEREGTGLPIFNLA